MKRTSSRNKPDSEAAPKLTQRCFDRATFRVAGKQASRAQWQAEVQKRRVKQG